MDDGYGRFRYVSYPRIPATSIPRTEVICARRNRRPRITDRISEASIILFLDRREEDKKEEGQVSEIRGTLYALVFFRCSAAIECKISDK